MKSTKEYQPLLNSLKTLEESGKVNIKWDDGHLRQEDEKEHVKFTEWDCRISLIICKSDTLDDLAEKVIQAETLMDELEWHLAHKQKSPSLYDYLYANLEL